MIKTPTYNKQCAALSNLTVPCADSPLVEWHDIFANRRVVALNISLKPYQDRAKGLTVVELQDDQVVGRERVSEEC